MPAAVLAGVLAGVLGMVRARVSSRNVVFQVLTLAESVLNSSTLEAVYGLLVAQVTQRSQPLFEIGIQLLDGLVEIERVVEESRQGP